MGMSQAEEAEIRECEDFPGYGVTKEGFPWSRMVKGSNSRRMRETWKPLKAGHNSVTKYAYVILRDRDGKLRTITVHTLVLTAFVGKCPEGLECRHLDGDPTNNRLDNLAWGTSSENKQDMARHGRLYQKPGQDNPKALLTEENVKNIIRIREETGMGPCGIAKRMALPRWAVSSVIYGQSWNWLTGLPRAKGV